MPRSIIEKSLSPTGSPLRLLFTMNRGLSSQYVIVNAWSRPRRLPAYGIDSISSIACWKMILRILSFGLSTATDAHVYTLSAPPP